MSVCNHFRRFLLLISVVRLCGESDHEMVLVQLNQVSQVSDLSIERSRNYDA